MNKCVFFDRDGVINRPPAGRYLTRWEEFELMPGIVSALRAARRLGYQVVIVSNQKCVALGIVTGEVVDTMHTRLTELLRTRHRVDVLDILYCPHDDGECRCRKPLPGLLFTAAERHSIDLAASWVVGDQERDVEAGRRAGCRTILVGRPVSGVAADHCVTDVNALESLFAHVLA